MKLTDFDYELPEALIAQHPPETRSGGRLLYVNRARGVFEHRRILDLPTLLPENAHLIVNNTKVFPARIYARRESGGHVEVLLLERQPGAREVWLAMSKSSKRLKAGERLTLIRDKKTTSSTEFSWDESVKVLTSAIEGRILVEFPNAESLSRYGQLPLPPYIRRAADEADTQRYQPIYAQHQGSVAAPTAGLHFNDDLLAAIRAKGVRIGEVTLHVGPGTFTPVRCDTIDEHRMEAERYTVPPSVAQLVSDAQTHRRPIVAVGTTVVRTLEASKGLAGEGRTELFIRPGYRFDIVNGLLTNFHLPHSTLLMLVCAFAGRELVLAAYREAVKERYRFYSYGDAMLIL